MRVLLCLAAILPAASFAPADALAAPPNIVFIWKGAAKPERTRKPQPAGRPEQTTKKESKPAPDRARAMKRRDVNGDGAITFEEYRDGLSNATNAAERFKNFDTNGDGKLTREEFVGKKS